MIIDDGSTDNTIDIVKERYTDLLDIKYYEREHLGLLNARKYGIEQIQTDYFMLCDSDLILDKNAIYNLLIYFNDKIGAVGGRLKPVDHSIISEAYSALRDFFYIYRTDWVHGGFSIFDKKIVDLVGGFRDNVGSEDVDIGFRIKKAGYTIIQSKYAVAYHRDPITLRDLWQREFKTGQREYFLRKNKHGS
jgi:cellulose synthase/poly-beta-1,6-N-acetylglucosamine synthase-like glycosyltransferase